MLRFLPNLLFLFSFFTFDKSLLFPVEDSRSVEASRRVFVFLNKVAGLVVSEF